MFAERLQRARMAAGLTQQDVADLLGIRRGTYASYEAGRHSEPNQQTLRRLADITGVSTDYLLGRTTNPHWEVIPEDKVMAAAKQSGIQCVKRLLLAGVTDRQEIPTGAEKDMKRMIDLVRRSNGLPALFDKEV